MNEQWFADFKEKLDGYYTWPTEYTFKFIVPRGQEDEIRNLFPLQVATERESKQGNYTSFTFTLSVGSSDAVIAIYQKVAKVKGLIAL